VNTWTWAALLGLILTACDADSVEVPQKLVNTYARVVTLRSTIADTTEAQMAVRKTLRDSGYSVESFEAELRSYGTNPQRMRALYDSVSKRLE
jgi:hypothetical protein